MDYQMIADALQTSLGEDDDLGIYLNERPSTPPLQESPSEPTPSEGPTNVSPNSSVSSGVFSCSDFEALSPPSFDSPGSPEPFRTPETTYANNQHETQQVFMQFENQFNNIYRSPYEHQYMCEKQQVTFNSFNNSNANCNSPMPNSREHLTINQVNIQYSESK